jgi:hypothetical protein
LTKHGLLFWPSVKVWLRKMRLQWRPARLQYCVSFKPCPAELHATHDFRCNRVVEKYILPFLCTFRFENSQSYIWNYNHFKSTDFWTLF